MMHPPPLLAAVNGDPDALLPHSIDVRVKPVDTFEIDAQLLYNDINYEFGSYRAEMLWDGKHYPTGFIRIHFEKPEDAVMAQMILEQDS